MKNIFTLKSMLVALLVVISCTMKAKTIEYTTEGFTYSLNTETQKATLNRYSKQATEVVIPEIVTYEGQEYKVTKLTGSYEKDRWGNYFYHSCFVYASSLASIEIPSSVTSLGYKCFEGCSSLTSIELPSSVTYLGDYCFYNCSKLTVLVDRYHPLIPKLWDMNCKVQDRDTGEALNKPYLEFSSYSTKYTSLTLKICNRVKGYTYTYGGEEIKEDDVITIKNAWPSETVRVYFYVSSKGFNYTICEETTIKENIPISFIKSFTSTSATVSLTLEDCGLDVVSTKTFIDNESTNGNSLQVSGLDPNTKYDTGYEITLRNAEGKTKTYKDSDTFTTNKLELKVLPPKVVSSGNVIVAAETNMDEEESHAGFEWRRTDWTGEFPSQTGAGHTYAGTMEGYIRNMNTEKLWKVRPYYLANSGTYYYGDWIGIDPSNTSYFEPTVHTYAKINVEGNTALVKGYALGGTDKVKVQGFKYWKNTASTRAANIPANAMTVEAEGQVMTATLKELDYASEYHYVAFVTTTEGETFYGDERTFSTGEDPTGIDAPGETATQPAIEVARYALDGRKLDAPQKGVNIIRMSDGTVRKVMVK